MYYKILLEKHDNDWVYMLTLEKNTPPTLAQANAYADKLLSAEDKHGIRHYVLLKHEKIIQIQLHRASQIIPGFDPNNPASMPMPAMQAIMFGNPPLPTLLVIFKEDPDAQNTTAYGLSPNVYLVFDDADLARLYITDVYAVIADIE